MRKTGLLSLLLCVCILLLLVPTVAADDQQGYSSTVLRKFRQEKNRVVFTADESIADGDRAKEGGDYIEALGDYNRAIDQIENSRLSQPEKNKKLAKIYQRKADLYRVRQDTGDDALATEADRRSESYTAAGTYSGPSSCFALLTYAGTPLEGALERVRDFRDNTIRKTFTGSRFMDGFNSFYYSFSPQTADLISRYPALKIPLSFRLAPLLGTVLISQGVFALLAQVPELAAVCTLITGGALYGFFYVFPIAALAALFASGRGWRFPTVRQMRPVAIIWLSGLALLSFGVLFTIDFVAVLGSAVLVVSSVVLSAGLCTIAYCRLMVTADTAMDMVFIPCFRRPDLAEISPE